LLASREYSLSTPLLLIALTAKYQVAGESPSMTAEVMVELPTGTDWLYWPDVVP
jgi:hypothetical protein